jgi:hypothetical protein
VSGADSLLTGSAPGLDVSYGGQVRPTLQRSWPLAAVLALVVGCALWGTWLNEQGVRIALEAPPFVGQWKLRLGVRTVLPVLVAGWTLWQGPALAQRIPWRALLVGTSALGMGWAVSLALVDGVSGLREPLTSRDEYLTDVSRVHDLTGFLGSFTSFINTYGGPHPWSTHVSGHPPGVLLLLAGLRGIGLAGPLPAALVFVAVGASAAAAVMVTLRAVCDEETARNAAPFLALTPAAVWLAVSADALFLGVSAWGIALLALSTTSRARAPMALAAGAGITLGCGLFLSYGLLPLGVLVLAVGWRGRRPAPLLRAGAGVLVVLGLFAALGFWWVDGFTESLTRYRAGAGGYRPYYYFVVADLAAFAVALGPAVVAGLVALRRHDVLWRITGAALAAVALADLSGAAKGEVERIWLIFGAWLVPAAVRAGRARPWLAAQALTGLVVQSVLVSKW